MTKDDLRRWLRSDGKVRAEWLELQIDAMKYVLTLFEIKYLDMGERYNKLEYARGVLKEFINDFEHNRKFLETKT